LIKTKTKLKFQVIHNGDDVYISSIERRDSGSYECIASNGYHVTISRSFYVTVQCKSSDPLVVLYFMIINLFFYSFKFKIKFIYFDKKKSFSY
jgi:hypothetical protein